MEKAIRNVNQKQLAHISRLMLEVFFDAKYLSLTEYSWPARHVVAFTSCEYDPTIPSVHPDRTVPENINLQYVNPHGHAEMMTTIVEAHRGDFMEKLQRSWAVSLRIDGSIDFTHIDKIYVMAKVINFDGKSELVLIGIAEQTQRKSIGLKNAVMEAIKTIIDDPEWLLRRVSSLCTDGTSLNTGDRSSLWQLLDEEMALIESHFPLFKIWCAAHRSELVWKDTAGKFKTVEKVLSTLSKISTYFHFSALRSAELKEIAKEKNFTLKQIPKIFTIRWTQFSFTLLRNILFSWEALTTYFERNKKYAEPAGFLLYLTKLHNLKLISFLADVLYTFQRFQKQLQSNRLTIVSMMSHVKAVKNALHAMESQTLLGGFEENLAKKLVFGEDGTISLKSIELEDTVTTRRKAEDFSELRKNILGTIQSFLDERFSMDEEYLNSIAPFITFSKTADVRKVHGKVAPDISLANLSLQFNDISSDPEMRDFKELSLNAIILKLAKTDESRDQYKEMITVLARIAACTPHSADVERCISANNRLKTKLRSSLKVEKENKYLFIHYNLPTFDEWNPNKAAHLFLAEKERRLRDITTSKEGTGKSREQPYFSYVFPEAQKEDEDEDGDDDQENEEDISSNKFFDF